MRLLHPRSTLTLILFGFGVVTLPLFVALGLAGLYVDRLSEQGQTTVYDAARAIQGSRSLSETLTTLERTARQYLLLDDPSLFEVYTTTHQSFQSIVTRLRDLTPDTAHRAVIVEIGQEEAALYERFADAESRDDLSQDEVAATFTRLAELADTIRRGSNRLIDREVAVMEATATKAQQWLFWIGAALIPLTLISSAIFTVLISRPIRQVDQAIRELGDGRFDRPIEVAGPEDLRALGEQLDWLRRRLIELESQKTRFLRHVSHELKTPLTAIRESGDLLSGEVVGPLNEEQREITGILGDSGRRLQGLIENLLDFSRTQSHRPALLVARLELGELVNAVLTDHKPALRAKGLRLAGEVDTCRMTGDADKLRTVVDNLVSNAIKFSPRNGVLTVSAAAHGDSVVLEVRDEGPGIPPAERERIFEAFFQGARQPAGYVKGSGLGLSIAREYVQAHGGEIEMSQREGPGTSLRVRLPRHASNAHSAAPRTDRGADAEN